MLIAKIFPFSKKLRKRLLLRQIFLGYFNTKVRFFNYRPSPKPAMSVNGRRLVRTKKFKFKFKNYKLFRYNHISKRPGLIRSVFFSLSKNCFISYTQTRTGLAFLLPTTEVSELFNYLFLFPRKATWLANNVIFSVLRGSKVGRKISMISGKNSYTPLYSKSNGTFCIIKHKPFFGKTVRLQLPSLEVKVFSNRAFCKNGRVSLPEWRKIRCNKVTNTGKRSRSICVRGVAKNPIDHPHGGNTKSIKWHRTPWGFSTKK